MKKRLEKRRWSVSLSIERQQSQDRGEQGDQDSNLQRTGRYGNLKLWILQSIHRRNILFWKTSFLKKAVTALFFSTMAVLFTG